jgi:GH15 family glucan-1,4-alpha-glucosidase
MNPPTAATDLTGNTGFAAPAAPSLSLGVVGNCAFSALIDPHGRVVWSCLPRFDGDPVFHALLGGEDGAGAFAIDIEQLDKTRQYYDPNTAVLHTELWDTKGQGLLITDFAPRFPSRGRYFRPTMLVRRVRPLQGAPRIRVQLTPRFD